MVFDLYDYTPSVGSIHSRVDHSSVLVGSTKTLKERLLCLETTLSLLTVFENLVFHHSNPAMKSMI